MMAITLVCGVLMAVFLYRHRQSNAPLMRDQSILPLAGYNLAMGLWCAGHLIVTMSSNSLVFSALGLGLIALNPLMPTLFLHFVINFIKRPISLIQTNLDNKISAMPAIVYSISRYMPILYGCSLTVVLVNIVFGQSTAPSWLDFPGFVLFDSLSWYSLIYTIVIGLVAHGLLLWAYFDSRTNRKNNDKSNRSKSNRTKTIVLLFIAAAWGFLTASSYVLPSLNIDAYPYLMWLIPTYMVFMTFAVLRYQWFFVNRLAIKTIIWTVASIAILLLITLLTSITSQLGFNQSAQGLALVELEVIWIYSLLSGSTLWLLYKPLNKLATYLVYPGININQEIIDHWLTVLDQSHDYQQLAQQAALLISKHIRQNIDIVIDERGINAPVEHRNNCLIYCYLSDNRWQFELRHWHEVNPTIRHIGEVFAPLVYSSCVALEKSLVLAKEEKSRQQQLRLAELGGLSAALAHELRNPLNIISMASATTDADTKQHIQQQLKRADTLIQDLLDYAKVIELKPQWFALKPLLDALVNNAAKTHHCQFSVQCADDCQIYADVHKLQQVVINCIDNAGAFAATVGNGQVLVSVSAINTQHAPAIELAFHNNGPAISEALTPQLFKPFISKRPGGSGLGLAIVQRIMEAHQGQVYYSQALDWPVSFICVFPLSIAAAPAPIPPPATATITTEINDDQT